MTDVRDQLCTMRRWLGCAAIAFASLGCDAISDDAEPATQPANVALGRPYTWNVPPDYPFCTTGTEATKLTDGLLTRDGRFWMQPTTTGWRKASPVIITVDLGAVTPISGVMFGTAAGSAEARWPAAIDLMVSDDGKQYAYVGDLVDLDAAQAGRSTPGDLTYSVHRFQCSTLKTRGRYIAFAVTPFNFTFVDEIEVYRGPDDLLQLPLLGVTYSDPAACLRQTATSRGIARRIARDALAVGVAPPPAATALPTPALGFRAVLPLSAEHRAIYRAAAAKMRAEGRSTPFAQACGPWDLVPHIGAPSPAGGASIDVVAMQNEYRAGALTITNPLDTDLQFDLQFDGLPGGATPEYISVAEVQFTDTRISEVSAAALPEAQRSALGWTIRVPSGMTRQVWLTFCPAGVPPGSHVGKVVLRGNDADRLLEVPVNLRVVPMRFPEQPTLSLGGWDYTGLESGNAVTRENRERIISHLRKYHVDSPWATKQVLPAGKHDPVFGTMATPPDTRHFDAWVRSWRGARRYCIFLAATDSFQGFHIDRPQFAIAVGQWVRFWAAHARQTGIDPSSLVLLPYDEPQKPAHDRIAVAWAKAIRAAGTGVAVWENPIHEDPAGADPQLFALSDILCPNRQILSYAPAYRRFFDAQHQRRARMELYSASGPARSLDPYAYYRLQAWECWRLDAVAQHFWSFGDAGGASSWNEYEAKGVPYTPLFVDAASVTPSKQMEAIREGIEDYEYLAMLRRRLRELEAQGRVTLKALEAKDLLETAAARVLPSPGGIDTHWRDARDRTAADKVRLQALDMLIALQ